MPFPAYAPDQLLPALRDYLIGQGVTRKPTDGGGLPPMWIDPRRGTPYPGQTEGLGANETHPDLILALYPATGIPSQPFEGFMVRQGATIYYRGRKSPTVHTKHEEIRRLLNDKRNLNFNGLEIIESMMTREIQRIGADERGFNYNCEYMFQMWASSYDY